MHDHLELGGDHLQHLADVLADHREPGPAAAGADRRRLVPHDLARKVCGQRLARAARAAPGRVEVAALILRRLRTCRLLRRRLLQVAQAQFQLLDLAIQLLRGGAEAVAAQGRQLDAQGLDDEVAGLQLGSQRHRQGVSSGCRLIAASEVSRQRPPQA